jgi:hypothetical protein
VSGNDEGFIGSGETNGACRRDGDWPSGGLMKGHGFHKSAMRCMGESFWSSRPGLFAQAAGSGLRLMQLW